ncbi:MAG: ribonuclease H-like domain-containing protein [Armatimonadota bacterium]
MPYQPEDYLDAVFLDIETNGINPAYSELTLIALYQQDTEKRARLYVNDLHGAVETLHHLEAKAQEYGYDSLAVFPLEQFVEHAQSITRIATFNGEQFDLPFITYHLPKVRQIIRTWQHLDVYLHVAQPLRDLRVLRTPNLKLKTLLERLQVPRHPSVTQLRGAEAVQLWNRWKHLYNSEALTALGIYALEDVRCTRLLLERLIQIRRGSFGDSC